MPTSSESDGYVSAGEMRRLIGVLLLGAWAALLDTTIVTLAVNDLAAAFEARVSESQWVVSIYLLAMAAAIPFMSWLVARWGLACTWTTALGMFFIGSALCACAWSLESLLLFRALQGLGGGLLLPLVQAILAHAAGPQRVARAMSLIGIPGQLAPMLGPLIGGLLLDTLGWRWLFLVNIPLCAFALWFSRRGIDRSRSDNPGRIDWIGAALLIPGLLLVVATLSTFSQTEPGQALILIAPGVLFLGAFAVHAWRRRSSAIVDITLLRARSYRAALLSTGLSGALLYAILIVAPLFLQQARHLSPAGTGLLMGSQGVGLAIGLAFAGRVTEQLGSRAMASVGVGALAVGIAAFAADWVHPLPLPIIAAALALVGFGLGAFGVAITAASYRDIPRSSIAGATALLNVTQRVGASFGAVLISISLSTVTSSPKPTATATGDPFAPALFILAGLLLLAMGCASRLPSRFDLVERKRK